MEKDNSAAKELASTLINIQLVPPRNPVVSSAPINSVALPFRKKKPQRLVSLCIEVLAQHLEDIIADIPEIAAIFPADIKLVLLAISRRRKLLNDNVLVSLADSLWETLDISGSAVTDIGLSKVSQICTNLRAVDISQCNKITVAGVTDLFDHCLSLTTLRCGGSPMSDYTVRSCLNMLKPKLDDTDGESWEELESMKIGKCVQSLCWLVWPGIDECSRISLGAECPRIAVNPMQGSFGARGVRVPVEAAHAVALDQVAVEDINPRAWAVPEIVRCLPQRIPDASAEMSVAEKFRLAFVERDARLAPKRAKNERQHRRRAERELLITNAGAKSLALASQATKFLR